MEKKQSHIISAALLRLDIPKKLQVHNDWYTFEEKLNKRLKRGIDSRINIISMDSNDEAKLVQPDGRDMKLSMKIRDDRAGIDFQIDWMPDKEYIGAGYFKMKGMQEPDPGWLEDNPDLSQSDIDHYHTWEDNTNAFRFYGRKHTLPTITYHIGQMVSKIDNRIKDLLR